MALTWKEESASVQTMRVLFTSLREKSHFLPLVPFLKALQGRGHEVAVSAPPEFAERVRATGAEFFPFAHPGDMGLAPIWQRMRVAEGDEAMRLAVGEIFSDACAGAAIPGLLATLAEWRPAIVVRETCEFAGLIAAEKTGIPHTRVAIVAQHEEEKIGRLAAAGVDKHGRGVGLEPDPAGERIRREVSHTLFPPSFEEATPAQVVHRARLRRSPVIPPLPEWWTGKDQPFVYVTLGMVAGGFDRLRAAYQATVKALSELPVRALLTVGMDLPFEALGELPSNVHVERFIPQDDVIAHAAAVLCHGGSGTVLGALAAGTPLVVTPMFADQPYNAERVAAIGAGLALPQGVPSAEAIKAALSRVVSEPSFRVAARKMAEEIAALPPVDEAVAEIERLAVGG